MFLTIFTPTYNRGYILPQLYKSLCEQTIKDFEWLVVDDGSNDDTFKLFENWSKENVIKIRYLHKENGGKPSAYNVGVSEMDSELFVCVDSDDYIVSNAVQKIYELWQDDKIKSIDGKRVIGQIFFRKQPSKTITVYNGVVNYSTLLDFYRKHGMTGDTMLVYRRDVVKKFKFPIIEGEKFVPEAYIYDLYDTEGLMHIYREPLYICEYLPDGYTSSMSKVICNNPRGYEVFIKQRLECNRAIRDLCSDTIRYVAIKLVINDKKVLKDCKHKILTAFLFFPGLVLYRLRYYPLIPKKAD